MPSRSHKRFEEERSKEQVKNNGTRTSVEHALQNCRRNLDALTKLRYRELIGDDEFVQQRAGLKREEMKLQEQLSLLKTEKWIEPSRNLFLFSNRAIFWLTHGTITEKRLILSTVGSNLTVAAKKLSIDANEPFLLLEKRGTSCNWWALVNDVRTFFCKNPEFSIPLLPDPEGPQIVTA